MDAVQELERGREAYRERAWRDAHDALMKADREMPLAGDDLWKWAMSAHLIGREDDFLRLLERACQAHLDAGEPIRAAHCAFWLGFRLASLGEMGRAGGWFGRASRILERDGRPCPETGYLRLPEAHQQLAAGDFGAAARIAVEVAEVAEEFQDADLLALALNLHGIALLGEARVEEGLARLDEAMVSVTTRELSPVVTGMIYCSAISQCWKVWELGRAREWTEALSAWCDRQPDLVSFRGECLVHRAEIKQLGGEWRAAIEEARRACDCFAGGVEERSAGAAFYRQGEVHRLLGEEGSAEAAYREASRLGYEPQPGLALLRMAQGKLPAAAAAIGRTLREAVTPAKRAALLPAHIEIAIEGGDLGEARASCHELDEISGQFGTSVLGTVAAQARGAVELAGGEAAAALPALREAAKGWQDLEAPYESARTRVLIAQACRALGDEEAAALELEVARAALEQLGAAPDLARIAALERGGAGKPLPLGLTPRELEVLRLLAAGRTNKAIARELFISERTVERHVSNLFPKLGVTSRAGATARAWEQNLL